MANGSGSLFLVLALTTLLAGCAGTTPAPQTSSGSAAAEPQAPRGPKRIVAAIAGSPRILANKFDPSTNKPGLDVVEQLISTGLTNFDDNDNLVPQLGEAVPTLDNGNWRLLPDGTMETSWTIRSGATWHDGAPLTTDDLLFTLQVGRDPQIAVAGDPVYAYLESVEARDARTIVVRWNRPYIRADRLFGHALALPLPSHILQKAYEENKATFTDQPYWSSEFVGSGPFKVKEFQPGVGLFLTAFDNYLMGRPRLDEVEVRFVLDLNTMVAGVRAGGIDLTMGRGISTLQAVEVRDGWREGTTDVYPRSWVWMFGQQMDPTPAVIADARFRKAVMHGINRQEMVDTIQYGLGQVADTTLNPDNVQYREMIARAPKYPFDPPRANAILAELGYTKGSDGQLRDASGGRLEVEMRTTADVDATVRSLTAVADYLQRLGMTINQVVIPTQRAGDRPYRASTPGLEILRGPTGEDTYASWTSRRIPLPENNYLVTGNYSRYSNPQWDALIDRFFTTIPVAERMQVLSDLVYWDQDQLPRMGLFFDTQVTLIANRLAGVRGTRGVVSTLGWDAETWDVH